MKNLKYSSRQRKEQKKPARFKRTAAALGLGVALAFCSPVSESIITAAQARPGKQARRPAYQEQTNPFELNSELRGLAQRFNSGSNRQKVENM
ncbi:hypothetical protein GF318_05775, partial [Candidatus Micrarchaeota archaeon]|nr:hypothetical protein [Candidatus Micrarchaeota archaeon]